MTAMRATKIFSYLIFLTFCWLLCGPNEVFARQLVFSDNFQFGLDNWQLVRGSPSHWQVRQDGLEAYIPARFTISELALKDDRWQPEWQNLEYEITFTPLEGVDKNLVFNFTDTSNWYEYHFTGNILHLVRLVSGSTPLSIFDTYHLENNRRYQLKIRSEAGQLSLFIDGELISTHLDPTYLPGTYGKPSLKATTGAAAPTRVLFEKISVYLIEPDSDPNPPPPPIDPEPPDQSALILPLETWKQTDPNWADQEYNHARDWSEDPTIKRWGCLLTSVAMVLNYHDIKTLPDGRVLTPSTLNHWLQEQKDGYVGQGLLNWLAITRLSREVAQLRATPVLEFKAVTDNLLTKSAQAISHHEPIILQISGHFFIGHGLINQDQTPIGTDQVIISDPYYEWKNLSDHQKELIGARRLIPTQTDLSYLSLVHDPALEVKLMRKDDQQILPADTLTDTIADPLGAETLPSNQVMSVWPKPQNGSHLLKLTSKDSSLRRPEIELFVYDLRAEFKAFSKTLYLEEHFLELTFTKESGGSWQNLATSSTWKQSLDYLWEAKLIPYYLYHGLTRLLVNFESPGSGDHQQTLKLIEDILNYYHEALDPRAYDILFDLIEAKLVTSDTIDQ